MGVDVAVDLVRVAVGVGRRGWGTLENAAAKCGRSVQIRHPQAAGEGTQFAKNQGACNTTGVVATHMAAGTRGLVSLHPCVREVVTGKLSSRCPPHAWVQACMQAWVYSLAEQSAAAIIVLGPDKLDPSWHGFCMRALSVKLHPSFPNCLA